jgi:hypothetical protein
VDDGAHVLAEAQLAGDGWRSASTIGWTSPTAIIVEAAMQRWPAQP